MFLIEQELNETGLGSIAVPLVADILDRARMAHIFSRYRPEVVFHAAAHKHVFLMERQPAEAIYNNAIGTRRLATMGAGARAMWQWIHSSGSDAAKGRRAVSIW